MEKNPSNFVLRANHYNRYISVVSCLLQVYFTSFTDNHISINNNKAKNDGEKYADARKRQNKNSSTCTPLGAQCCSLLHSSIKHVIIMF